MRRVGIIGFEHETNTYRPEPTTMDAVDVREGPAILEDRGRRSYLGGIVDGIEALGAEPVPLVVAGAQPSGAFARDVYEALRDRIVAAVRDAGPLDGVVANLHGAAVAEGHDDVEADLGTHLRAVLGDVPLTGALDLHANLTPATAAPWDALVPVKFYPHTDMYERGREAAELLEVHWRGGRTVTVVERLPWLLAPVSTDVDGPRDAVLRCDEAEREPHVLDASFVHGFSLADGPQVGASVVVTTDGDPAQAQAVARRLAAAIWADRERFVVPLWSPAEAVARAVDLAADPALRTGPVVLAETSDNPGGGGLGDSTHLLRALLDAGVEAAFASVLDPATAAQAHAAGAGATVAVALGGRLDPTSGAPVVADAVVEALGDGRYVMRGVGSPQDLGPTALLRIGSVRVVVASRNQQVFDDGPFRIHGLDPRTVPVVGLKSANHFRASYRRVAREILLVSAPGLSRQDVRLERRRSRPGWPEDRGVTYPPA